MSHKYTPYSQMKNMSKSALKQKYPVMGNWKGNNPA